MEIEGFNELYIQDPSSELSLERDLMMMEDAMEKRNSRTSSDWIQSQIFDQAYSFIERHVLGDEVVIQSTMN